MEHTSLDRTVRYGRSPEQVADLRSPRGVPPAAGWPVVVLIHGGFWRDRYRRDLMVPLAVDLGRVAVVGHSAGGHLALWVAGRSSLPAGAPGASPVVRPCAAVGQAPVAALAAGTGLGDGAVLDFVGGTPAQLPERYAVTDPVGLVGHGVPVLLVHGEGDDTVPLDQSERYEAAASAAGDPVELLRAPGDHFTVIDPASDLWAETVRFLDGRC